MALETATYIDGLVATNPAASDAINTADDHLRLIKSTIKATFPNINGAVTLTPAQINALSDALLKAGGTMTGALILSGAPTADLHASTKKYVDDQFVGGGIIPSGGIIMWSGSVASIPTGWYLCNGSNGTPDLRDRFVIGAGNSYAVAATGGSKDAIVVSHTHTATSTVTDPGHSHTANTGSSNNAQTLFGRYSLGTAGTLTTNSATTGISVATSIDSTGSSGTNANLPPYYSLAYIMKG